MKQRKHRRMNAVQESLKRTVRGLLLSGLATVLVGGAANIPSSAAVRPPSPTPAPTYEQETQTVMYFLDGIKRRDFDYVFSTMDRYQRDIERIKNRSPQVLWDTRITEYKAYVRKVFNKDVTPGDLKVFWQRLFEEDRGDFLESIVNEFFGQLAGYALYTRPNYALDWITRDAVFRVVEIRKETGLRPQTLKPMENEYFDYLRFWVEITYPDLATAPVDIRSVEEGGMPAPLEGISGKWVGTWKSNLGLGDGKIDAYIFQSGSELSGSVLVEGSPYFRGASLQGNLSSNQLSLGFLLSDINVARFSGDLSGDQQTLTGIYETPTGDRGSWKAQKVPIPYYRTFRTVYMEVQLAADSKLVHGYRFILDGAKYWENEPVRVYTSEPARPLTVKQGDYEELVGLRLAAKLVGGKPPYQVQLKCTDREGDSFANLNARYFAQDIVAVLQEDIYEGIGGSCQLAVTDTSSPPTRSEKTFPVETSTALYGGYEEDPLATVVRLNPACITSALAPQLPSYFKTMSQEFPYSFDLVWEIAYQTLEALKYKGVHANRPQKIFTTECKESWYVFSGVTSYIAAFVKVRPMGKRRTLVYVKAVEIEEKSGNLSFGNPAEHANKFLARMENEFQVYFDRLASEAKQEAYAGRFETAKEKAAEVLKNNPAHFATLQVLAYVYAKQGDLAAAKQKVDACQATTMDHPDTLFIMAIIAAKEGNGGLALDYLDKAIQRGFKDTQMIAFEPAFAIVKDDPRFNEIIAQKGKKKKK